MTSYRNKYLELLKTDFGIKPLTPGTDKNDKNQFCQFCQFSG